MFYHVTYQRAYSTVLRPPLGRPTVLEYLPRLRPQETFIPNCFHMNRAGGSQLVKFLTTETYKQASGALLRKLRRASREGRSATLSLLLYCFSMVFILLILLGCPLY